jgi:hypothetical protein
MTESTAVATLIHESNMIAVRDAARKFMDTELGGHFYEDSVVLATESFSAKVEAPFIYKDISFKRGATLVMDLRGDIFRVRFA